ncbi:DNA-3-methyladenine glycosylase 2 family protein [Vibrio sagamiensis]|uniref:3-methyladenine DNA glycosylase n=1 Tax=Vibrio sagamiensis NBRC 104589 TaxID=1219064 RepID=A0A511QDC4_9VIBR|nr:AlkA N-terminal domain-containing protein [Vibrio sagamiensis]PNQ54295.1 DNA-3-methyladenine glycosylase 2 family protein [Vibrio agarivorans]GEM75279.1 3-methyladenine DNA glycosylase [Vibrio sagamiensis NBRC 104589]
MFIHPHTSLTFEQCQKARMSRDSRFDGYFYIAVKTTGIFCRPICPANLPQEKNIEYFIDKNQALKAGYRPCLRCRPDSLPNTWAWKGTETTFQRALKMIECGALYQGSLVKLSERLGISDRYLRKLFNKYLGISPKQYAQYQQLLFAKHLLHTSSMSITEIGFASGFNSIRRFNDSFRKKLNLTPSQVKRRKFSSMATHQLDLPYKGQLNWQHMLAFYQVRAIDRIERVTQDSYQRHIMIDDCCAYFEVKQGCGQLEMSFDIEDMTKLQYLVAAVRRMFDLDTDIKHVEEHLVHVDQQLVSVPGLRIPGVWNIWEAGVRAILGQQVSVKAAIGQLNLLVSTLCEDEQKRYFPTPEMIAQADVSFLRMPQSRKDALVRFAQYMLENPDSNPQQWLELKGIGPWTVSYAILRGQSHPDCFLDKDLIIKKAIKMRPSINADSVSPWGSYATFHLWNQS